MRNFNYVEVGTIGHVAHGKSTMVKTISGVQTVRSKSELEHNITLSDQKIPVPVRDFVSPAHLIIIRSFDVNKPGSEVDDIEGGVAFSRIVSLYAEQNELQFAVPGGLIGVGTAMDPTLTRADRLVGHVLGENFESSVLLGGSDFIPFDPTTFGMSLPTSNTNDILLPFPFLVNLSLWLYFTLWCILLVNFFVLRRFLGVATKGPEEQVKVKVSKLAKGEQLMLNIGSMTTGAKVLVVKNDLAKLQLTVPVCTNRGEKIGLSRCIETLLL
ncbi:hypothetical protein K1719_002757 [Acacia pycnantha]|nr:hypothetical protein K1719_002757 [Acacia pycnantha]